MNTPRTALLSVSDKTGIVDLAAALVDQGWRILSTGGTATTIAAAGLPVTEVSGHTGFPEIMDGRVKTLHPAIHGGLLARAGVDDDALTEHGITAIDLLAVNLYPFAATVARPDCTFSEAIEQIDVGGPAMLRAAAKNHGRVCVLTDPDDYASVAAGLPQLPDPDRRRALAVKAFAHTAAYDGQISQWLSAQAVPGELPPVLNLSLDRIQSLRYGENPHQAAGLYRERTAPAGGLAGARPIQGKALSYNNLLDADAAWKAVRGLNAGQPACVIIKHTNPCGAAQAETIEAAYQAALACDPTSAFGGIIAFNRQIDPSLARLVTQRFVEVVLAPSLSVEASEVFAAKPNLRVIVPEASPATGLDLRPIDGGWLVQQTDRPAPGETDWTVATRRAPSARERADLHFAWAVVQTVRSNAIVYARDQATIGIGAGQMSRVDSARIGAWKAAEAGLDLADGVMASDAFFPFADSIETAAERGIRAVIQPGGSMRDQEVIEACDRHDIAMILTGRRHFRH
ncbi:MAG: bifunctional phosphoribosylaminoimidazolecarboxamide formyltransferase/IMP cyclohydrolase PurH [Wenzhouxiangella sp.]|nr:MAG: bifunctional phosphoribosylaminoimidazolecarboxamide formyltransferase/IMP cyclohydrolase PurH [Wenzhouxiangella sp.]